ncbi:MAG: hypothetical protein XD98_0433 [Microgenomates bacterium 39_6]|nr:MAG: hypothetical protein XD98_0433 [Microgenomates bacterium 39_6]
MSNQKKQIEIELRALLNKEEYQDLKKFLKNNALDLGEDNKNVYFFLLPKKIVKVVNNLSKKTAEIVMKLNRLGKGSNDFEEITLNIKPSDFKKAVKIFSQIDFEQVQKSFQKRHNYRYRGVDLALKYSQSWGYHLELEIVIDNISKQKKAEEKIRRVAKVLGVRVMTEKEIAEFARKIDQKH